MCLTYKLPDKFFGGAIKNQCGLIVLFSGGDGASSPI
jgi:hypothetical protein